MPTSRHVAHLGSFAMHGVPMTWTEATAILPGARTGPWDAGIYNEEHVKAWRIFINFVHSQGQKIGIQLWHAGRNISTAVPFLSRGEPQPKETGGFPEETVGPSAIACKENFPMPREMSAQEIHDCVRHYAEAAERSVRAGFDTVEIHAAHGFLTNNFLSPVSNHRTDQYGGSFENRARLFVEIADAIGAVIPASMPIFLRISTTEWLDKSRPELQSWTNEDSCQLAKHLIGKIDVIDISTGGQHPDQKISTAHWSETPAGKADQAQFAPEIKKAVGDQMLVNAVGRIHTGECAEELLQDGLDLVAIGRPFRANPGFVNQLAEELHVDVAMAIQHAYVWRGRGFAAKKKELGSFF